MGFESPEQRPSPEAGIIEELREKISSMSEADRAKLKEIWENAEFVRHYDPHADNQKWEGAEVIEAQNKWLQYKDKLNQLMAESSELLPSGIDDKFIISHFDELRPVFESLG